MIVNEFNGDINFDSKYGIGSTFEFSFVLDKPIENQATNMLRIKNPANMSYQKLSLIEYARYNQAELSDDN